MAPDDEQIRQDPTSLTTLQVQREILHLKELIYVRLDAMDKAMALFEANITRVPTDTDKAIGHLKELMEKTFELHDSKYRGVQTQFTERDTRVEQTSRDSKLAIDAALQAAKEAVGKSETSTIKQIDAQGLLIATSTRGLETTINDVKGRLDRIEGAGLGGRDTKANLYAILGAALGIGGLLFALLKP